MEGWTDIMYYVQDAHSFWDWIYFVLLIVVSFRLRFLFSNTTRVLVAKKGYFVDRLVLHDQPLPGRHSDAI